MTIPLFEITNYDGNSWDDFLTKICLYDIFKELVEEYQNDNETLSGYIKYIVWAYSQNSPKIIYGMDLQDNKKEIFKMTKLSPSKVHKESLGIDGVFMNKTVLKAIDKWKDFQNSEIMNAWFMLSDMIIEFRIAANAAVAKGGANLEIDYKIKKECALSVIEFLQRKKELENNFIQNTPQLKEAFGEVAQVQMNHSSTTMGMESMLKSRKDAEK